MISSLSSDSLYETERHSVKRHLHVRSTSSSSAAAHQNVTAACEQHLASSLIDLNDHLRSTGRQHFLQQTIRTHLNFTAIDKKALALQSQTAQMATSSKMEVLNSSTVRPFENDDYDYLINCTDLITTCQEALQENNFEADQCEQNHSVKSEENSAKLSPLCHNCDEHVSLRSPSSAASSGLGLSLEEDSSLKYCHSDEEFSSLNSTSAESFSAKALVAEFIEWLDYAENQLDSVCYCAKIASSTSGVAESLQLPHTEAPTAADTTGAAVTVSSSSSFHPSDDLADCRSASDHGDKCADVNRSAVLQHCAKKKKSDAGVNEQNEGKAVGQQSVAVIDHEDSELEDENVEGDEKEMKQEEEEVVVGEERKEKGEDAVDVEEEEEEEDEDAFYEDEEAEELMMSLRPERQFRGSNSKKTTRLCLSETVADWSVILARFKAFHNEFEKIAHRFLTETSAIKQSLSGSLLLKSLHPTQKRCQNLWLKVLEYSIILQDYPAGTRCPRHFSRKLSSRVQPQLSPEKHSLRPQQPQQQQQHQSEAESIKSALGGSYNSIFASGPLAQYRAIVCGGLRRAGTANGSLNRKVELKSTGTGGSSVSIHHRRVQTRSDSTMMEHQEAVIDTHSADGSGTASPGADSGVFSSSTDGKYEVIQKDIGYSSDADMSDAIEAHPHSSDQNSSQRLARKRQVRRRRTRTARPRPWSYHADWTDWDYYQTPFVYNEQGSNEDNFDNENAVRKLTEFGENYESWINNEIELADELKSLKPAVVIEKPEIEAYCERALVEKADVATSPIPFLEEEIDDEKKTEKEDEQAVVVKSCAAQTIESKSTQTAPKSVADSACMTAAHHSESTTGGKSCSLAACKSCASASANSYSSIKFYTSLALAGLFAIFFAVSQFSPEIHKSYSRPPPL